MPLFAAFILGLVTVVVALVIRHTISRHQRAAALFERVGASVGGRVDTGHWLLRMPILRFRVRACSAELEFTSSGGRYPELFTEITVRLSGAKVVPLQLGPEGFLTKMGKLFGFVDLEVGDREFDAAFSISTSSPAQIRRFLSPSVRKMLLRILALGNSIERLWIEVESGRFFIRKLSWLEEEWQLRQFLETSVQIIEAYLDEIGERQLTPPDPERCPVCKDLLSDQARACRWCGVRHHPECFELNDGCGHCGAKAETSARPSATAEG
ncbi:MAG: hypothetical protein ACOX6T_02320 [Myxococcales bacterium]|jgi:hypothetical protein